MKHIFCVILSTLIVGPFSVYAQKVDEHSEKALQQTQDFMRDAKQREAFINSNGNAKAADAQLKSVLGNNPGMTDEAYGLAAEVMGMLVQKHQGNPEAIAKDLEKFAKDPASFLSQWTPQQREKLRSLADRARKPSQSPK